MSISSALANALSGLSASARMTETVSSNLANVMTDGYARRDVELGSRMLGGVSVVSVNRHANPGILSERRLSDADFAGHSTMAKGLAELEQVIGAAGTDGSLSDRVARLEEALTDAAADPASDTRLSTVLRRLGELVASVNEAGSDIQVLRYDADASIATQVGNLNTALEKVESLNSDISRLRAVGQNPAGLMDQRQVVIDQISEIVPVRVISRMSGQVALMTTSGEYLVDGTARDIGFDPVTAIVADMTLASGGLHGLTIDGDPVSAPDGFGPLSGGSLAATFNMRDDILVDVQSQVDAFAADLISRFQQTPADPTLAAGAPGLFTDDGAVLDPLDTVALSQRLSVNSLVDPGAGGSLAHLRDGLGAVVAGPVGYADQLLASLSALTNLTAVAPGGSPRGAAGHAAAIVADIGALRLDAESEMSFAAARNSGLREAEAAEGVDTDFELQTLMRIEQAYAANAKVIQTADSLISMLMEL